MKATPKQMIFYVCAGLIVAFSVNGLREFFQAPLITLEDAKRYTRELSGEPDRLPIIVFYTSWCGACKATREFLDKEGIPYVPAEIEENLTAQYFFNELTGGGGSPIPVTIVGDAVIVGYRPWTILAAVKNLTKQ